MPRDIKPKPKPTVPVAVKVPKLTAEPKVHTMETNSFIDGLFAEFRSNVGRYQGLTAHQFELEARIEMTEKTLCLMRDHLRDTIERADCAAPPRDWKPLFEEVRFVGVRLVDACMTLLQEHGKLTQEELLTGLNGGMFRFRTSSPLREIHAAMLRQRRAKKLGNTWVWIGGGEEVQMRLRVATPSAVTIPTEEDATGTD